MPLDPLPMTLDSFAAELDAATSAYVDACAAGQQRLWSELHRICAEADRAALPADRVKALMDVAEARMYARLEAMPI
jgi:hypothetical protein